MIGWENKLPLKQMWAVAVPSLLLQTTSTVVQPTLWEEFEAGARGIEMGHVAKFDLPVMDSVWLHWGSIVPWVERERNALCPLGQQSHRVCDDRSVAVPVR